MMCIGVNLDGEHDFANAPECVKHHSGGVLTTIQKHARSKPLNGVDAHKVSRTSGCLYFFLVHQAGGRAADCV